MKPRTEDVNVPVKKGDTILVGKWKNKPIKVTSQGEDDHGMPTINGRKAVTFRKPEPKTEGALPMKISRATLRALIEAELAELGPKATRLGGRYGGEPDFAIADPGNKDVENPVIQGSAKGGSNKSIRRPVSEGRVWKVPAGMKAMKGKEPMKYGATDLDNNTEYFNDVGEAQRYSQEHHPKKKYGIFNALRGEAVRHKTSK